MSKSIALIVTAIALPGAALFALPASAATTPGAPPAVAAPIACGDSPNADDDINDASGRIASDLKAQGYNVSGVEDFGGCVRAYVKGADGQTQMVYFTRTPVRQIVPNG